MLALNSTEMRSGRLPSVSAARAVQSDTAIGSVHPIAGTISLFIRAIIELRSAGEILQAISFVFIGRKYKLFPENIKAGGDLFAYDAGRCRLLRPGRTASPIRTEGRLPAAGFRYIGPENGNQKRALTPRVSTPVAPKPTSAKPAIVRPSSTPRGET